MADNSSQYDDAFRGAAEAYKVDPDILKSMAHAESGFSPDVISGKRLSSTGAAGLMQFMPETAKRYGIDPLHPEQAIFGAAKYLRDNLDKFNGDYAKAVAAYNTGENRTYFDKPDWHKSLPSETLGYVDKVLKKAHDDSVNGVTLVKAPAPTPAAPVPAAPKTPAKPQPAFGSEVPQWARDNPRLYGAAQAARQTLGPTLEGLLSAGGALLGSGVSPVVGTVAGGAGGYALAKNLLRPADVALGNAAPETPTNALVRGVNELGEGALYQGGGMAAVPILGKAITAVPAGIAKGAGWVADTMGGNRATLKAARLAQDAIKSGGQSQAVNQEIKNALIAADNGLTAGQATADVNNPLWQALMSRGANVNPAPYTAKAAAQAAQAEGQLAGLAGGATQTEARATGDTMKQALKNELIPKRDIEMNAANIAGKLKPKLDAQTERFAQAAANKVEDVRRFTAAGPRGEAIARSALIEKGQPVGATKYTYVGGDLPQRAERVAAQAADASLPFGEAARFSQAASDSLAAHGLKPLSGEAVSNKIAGILSDPKFAGNDVIDQSVKKVASDIAKWTNNGGVVDAFALDAIRKNSVNGVIRQLYPNESVSAQKSLAAGVLSRIKPAITQAIEDAGGTGYSKYLEDYSEGLSKVAQTKLSAEALNLFKTNKQGFVNLVEGNTPDAVEKIMGAGNYDIAKQLSEEAMQTLKGVAKGVATDKAVADQTAAGSLALRNLLLKDMSVFRLPSYLSVATSSINKGLSILEQKLGKDTMNVIAQAGEDPQKALALINTLPTAEKNRVLKILSDAPKYMEKGASKIPDASKGWIAQEATNALAGNRSKSENQLAQ